MRRRLFLYIEGHKVDLSDDGLVLWNYQHSDLYNPAAVKNSYSQNISLPGTPTNDDIFGAFFRADRRLGDPTEPARLLMRSALRSSLRMLGASNAYTLPVTDTPAGWVTSDIAGQVAFDNTIGATEVTTLTAQVRPGFRALESGGAAPVTELESDTGSRCVFIFLQGIGYDADGNAIAATPTLLCGSRAQSGNFPTADVVAACGYVPNPLNTSYSLKQCEEQYLSEYGDLGFWMGDGDGAPGYYDLSLTATGMQRMEVRMVSVLLPFSYAVSTGYTIGEPEDLALFYQAIRYRMDAWAVQFGTTSGESDTDPSPDPGPDPPDPPGPGPDPDPPTPPVPDPDPLPEGNYRTKFDPSKRADFAIYDEAGQIAVSGYCRLVDVVERAGIHTYSLALYGGLGGFMYALSYKSDGSKMTLADLDYLGGGETELDFTITAEAVADAWARIGGDTSKSALWDIINFAPCYNGIPDNFSADKAIARPADVGLTSPVDNYYPKLDYALVNLPKDYDEWAVRDLRSYLQRPVVSVRAIFAAIANSTAWEVDYSDIDSIPYLDTWLTRPLLPGLGTFKQTSGTATATFNSLGEVQSDNPANIQFSELPAGSNVKTTITFTLGYRVAGVTGNNLKPIGPQTTSGRSEQVLFVQAIGFDSNAGKVAAGKTYAFYDSALEISAEAMAASCGYTGDSLNTEFATAQREHNYRRTDGDLFERTRTMSVEIEGVNIDSVLLVVRAYQVVVRDGYAYDRLTNNTAYAALWDNDGNYLVPTAAFTTGSAEVSYTSTDSLRSGARITKAMLLSTGKTPAEYLVSFCKMFGLYIVADDATKTIKIMRRATFFEDDTIDLTERIDRTHDIYFDSLAFTAKWYELRLESVGGRFEDEYLKTEGVQYGIQRVDTGYDFDAEIYDILAGSAFKSCAAVRDHNKYWFIVEDSRGVIPSPFMDTGCTYTLWNADEENKDIDIPTPGNDVTLTPFNNGFPGYDLLIRAEFRDAENKPVDGADVLLFYNYNAGLPEFRLTDDLAAMDTINGGPCWILGKSSAVLDMPYFSRLSSIGQEPIDLLDLGYPRQVDIPNSDYAKGETIYIKAWRTFLWDRLNVNNKIMRCRVDLSGLDVGVGLLRKFYWYRNSLWVLNKISNYSLTTFDPAECEFVQVRDISNYKNQY